MAEKVVGQPRMPGLLHSEMSAALALFVLNDGTEILVAAPAEQERSHALLRFSLTMVVHISFLHSDVAVSVAVLEFGPVVEGGFGQDQELGLGSAEPIAVLEKVDAEAAECSVAADAVGDAGAAAAVDAHSTQKGIVDDQEPGLRVVDLAVPPAWGGPEEDVVHRISLEPGRRILMSRTVFVLDEFETGQHDAAEHFVAVG
jgi:hypothetical protein